MIRPHGSWAATIAALLSVTTATARRSDAGRGRQAHEGARRLRGPARRQRAADPPAGVDHLRRPRPASGSSSTCSIPTPPGSSRSRSISTCAPSTTAFPSRRRRGPKGADRITILDDPDDERPLPQGEGLRHRPEPRLRPGLGHGGVFVVQPPYLLFYPDRDGDDVPDGDPEVLLTGFGMEDAHAFANSLHWGPDGWLYGAQGSTVTANIRGIEFQQGIWRYHPLTKEFELFAEGGGNTWGLDFDRHGNVIAGTNWGGIAMLHQVQGGYYVKGFGKHGPLHNPHTYGYFDHVPYTGLQGRPRHLRRHRLPGRRLSRDVRRPVHRRQPALQRRSTGTPSSRKGSTLHGSPRRRLPGRPTTPGSGPIDCLTGPDGARLRRRLVRQARQPRRSGRQLGPQPTAASTRSRPKGAPLGTAGRPGQAAEPGPGGPARPPQQLVRRRGPPHPRRAARPGRLPGRCARMIHEEHGPAGPGSAVGAVRQRRLRRRTSRPGCWPHRTRTCATWTVRLLGDARKITPASRDRLVTLARTEPSPDGAQPTRLHVQATAGRRRPADRPRTAGPHRGRRRSAHPAAARGGRSRTRPISDRDAVARTVRATRQFWRLPLCEPCCWSAGQRYVAEGGEVDHQDVCATASDRARSSRTRTCCSAGWNSAARAAGWRRPARSWRSRWLDLRMRAAERRCGFASRCGWAAPTAYRTAVAGRAATQAAGRRTHRSHRSAGPGRRSPTSARRRFGSVDCREDRPGPCGRDHARRCRRLRSDPHCSRLSLSEWSPPSGSGASSASSRPSVVARQLLEAVDDGPIPPKACRWKQLRRMAAYKDEQLDKLIAKHWGRIAPATAGEKLTHDPPPRRPAWRGAGRRGPRQGAVHQELCDVPHAVRRGRQDRPRPDRRRPQEPRLAADQHRGPQRRHPARVRRLQRRHEGRPIALRPHRRPDAADGHARRHQGRAARSWSVPGLSHWSRRRYR